MTYQYKCPTHGQFELSRPITDYKAVELCPICKSFCERDYSDYKPLVQLNGNGYGTGGLGWR